MSYDIQDVIQDVQTEFKCPKCETRILHHMQETESYGVHCWIRDPKTKQDIEQKEVD